MIVDDDRSVLFTLERALERLAQGIQIGSACSCREALGYILLAPFDLVLTDIHMPDLGGVELTEVIRSYSPSTAVIWMTGCPCLSLQSHQKRLGVSICLEKPFEVQCLRNAVLSVLGVRRP
ncbi:MAG: response regulator [Chloroflexi bacterium]|nr:response regulator [Chloroflexota bacterium]